MTDVRLTATNPVDSSVVPVACNEKGELLLEEPSISSDEFVAKAGDTMTGNLHLGDKIVLNPDGSAQFAGGALDVYDNGTVITSGSAEFAGTATFGANSSQITNATDTTPGSLISSGGTQWQVFNLADSNNATNLYNTRSGTKTLVQATKATGALMIGGDIAGDAPNTALASDGSATFSGDVVVGSRSKKWMIVESNGLAHLVEQTTRESDGEHAEAGVELAEAGVEYPQLRDIPGELTMVEQQLQKVMEALKMAPQAGWEVWDGSD